MYPVLNVKLTHLTNELVTRLQRVNILFVPTPLRGGGGTI